jgi:hypothetical protein
MEPKHLKITPAERETIDWCCMALDELQLAEIEEEAREIAAVEIHAPEAAAKLLPLLVEIIVRNARERE